MLFFYNGQASARSTSQAIWQQGVMLAQFNQNTLTTFTGTALSGLTVTLPTISEYGFSSVCSDGNNGVYALQTVGSLVAVSSGLTVSSYALPANETYSAVGLLSGVPYILCGSSGNISVLSGTTVVPTNVTLSTPCSFLSANGGTFYSLNPASSDLVETTFSSLTSGTTTSITVPMSVPVCVAASGTLSAVAGYSYPSIASGFAAIEAYTSNSATDYILGIVSGTVAVMSFVTGVWAISATLVLGGSLAYMTLVPDGTQALITDSTNGYLYVVTVTNTSLAQAQKISLTGAADVSILPLATQAIVTQPSQNLVSSFNNTAGVWSLNTSFTITNPTVVDAYDTDSIAVRSTSGIAWYQYSGSTWNLIGSVDTTFTITDIITDASGNFYVVGTATSPKGSSYGAASYGSLADSSVGTYGFIAIYNTSFQLVTSTSWPGGANSLLIDRGQIAVLDHSTTSIKVLGLVNNVITLVTSFSITGVQAIGQGNRSFIASTSTSVVFYEWGPPYTLIIRRVGICSIYNGSAWTSVNLGDFTIPTAIAFDDSNDIWLTTDNNKLFEISSSGTILSETTLPQAPNQNASVPLGISSLLWWNGHLYGTSSLAPNFIEVQ